MGKCPICERTKLVKGMNAFVDVHPEYVKLWSPHNSRTPNEILYNSSLWLRWICPTCNGDYGAYIESLVSGDATCPFCEERKVLPGYNSLSGKHPELMSEWDYTNNYLLSDPDHISDKSNTPVWWGCQNDSSHKYRMTPSSRLMFQKRHKEPCPDCKGRRRKKRHFV